MRLETVLGDDSIGSLTDDHYLGADNVDPEQRTGLAEPAQHRGGQPRRGSPAA